MYVYSDIDTYDTTGYTPQQIVILDSNRIYDPKKVWKKFYSCKGLSKSQNLKW